MKRKLTIPRPEPENLILEIVAQDDRTLPKAPGRLPKTGKLTLLERRNLEADYRARQTARTPDGRRAKIVNANYAELRRMQAERERERLRAIQAYGGLIPATQGDQFLAMFGLRSHPSVARRS
jgi:hypothetical protein